MRKLRHRKAALAASLLVGCGSAAQPVPARNTVEKARLDPANEVEQLLARDAVTPRRFARATLYTWTTAQQIDELRTTHKLLSRDESPTSGASYIDQILHLLAQQGDPLAKTLDTTAFANSRFAWPSMWPTRAGWPTEQYGNQLIRIQLEPDAWIVAVSSDAGIVGVHDLHDEAVPLATAIANPQRIAAIYFVSDASVSPAQGIPRPLTNFREYVVCNESMIESWEVGTTRIARELDLAAATIDAVIAFIERAHPKTLGSAAPIWRTMNRGGTHDAVRAYYEALALDNDNYKLEAQPLQRLVTLLRQTPKQAPIEGVPNVAFAPGIPRKPPRIVNRSVDVSFARPSPTAAHP